MDSNATIYTVPAAKSRCFLCFRTDAADRIVKKNSLKNNKTSRLTSPGTTFAPNCSRKHVNYILTEPKTVCATVITRLVYNDDDDLFITRGVMAMIASPGLPHTPFPRAFSQVQRCQQRSCRRKHATYLGHPL